MTLTEEWKKGGLEDYKKYYCKTKWFEDIFQARCYDKDTEDEWWSLENEKYKYNNVYHTKGDIEVLAPVPSYEKWQELKEFADYSLQNRDELTRQINFWVDKNNQIEKENQQLKELLKECGNQLYEYSDVCLQEGYEIEREEVLKLKTKIDEVLK